MRPYLAVVGPTCVGKTRHVKTLLQLYPFELINLDSFQAYSYFKIGTGRQDIAGNEGHLFSFVDPRNEVSPARYVRKVLGTIEQIVRRGHCPLFEGGSLRLLRALLTAVPLKLVGIRPPSASWSRHAVKERMESYPEEKLIDEIKEGLRLGFRNTRVMLDDVVYLPLVDYVDNKLSLEAARRRIVTNLLHMHRRQLREYQELMVEWITAGQNSEIHLRHIVETSRAARCATEALHA